MDPPEMDRRGTERREARAQRGSGRKSRTGLASGIPSAHVDSPVPGHGFAVPPPARTVSPQATERAQPVDPDRGFAVPAPSRLSSTATLQRSRSGHKHERVTHPFLTNRHRPVPGTDRFGLAAGQVLVVIVVCFLVWTLLSAHSLHKASEAAPDGARRTASLTVLGPIDTVSHVLFFDRLAAVLQGAVGHDPDKVSPGGLADGPQGPPPTQPSLAPSFTPTPEPKPSHHGGGIAHPGGGNGHHGGGNCHGGNGNHPTARPTGTKTSGTGSTLAALRVPTAANPLRALVVGDSSSGAAELGLAPAAA